MRFVSFYHRETGMFHDAQLMTCDDASVVLNTPEDHQAIDGYHDRLSKRVDISSGKVIEYQPPAPGIDHEWDSEAKRWKLSTEAVARDERGRASRVRIAHLEANVQPRALRESALNRPGALKRLQDVDDEIAELRKQLGKG